MTKREDKEVTKAMRLYTDSNQVPDQYWDPFETISPLSPATESFHGEIRLNPNKCIAGYSLKELGTVETIYDLIIPSHLDRSLYLINKVLNHRNEQPNHPKNILQCRMDVCHVLKGKNNKKYYYRRSGRENGMINGRISHAVSWWEDLSFVSSTTQFHYFFDCPNSEFIDVDIPEITFFQNVLTNREVEILRLLARGLSSHDIGRILKITKNTVDTHRRKMLSKLEVANTPELVMMARDMNIIQ